MSGQHRIGQAARDRAVEYSVGKLMLLVPPWAGAFLLVPAGVIMHREWPDPAKAAIVAAVIAALTVLACKAGHDQTWWHRAHVTGTAAGAAAFLISAQLAGFTSTVWFVWLIAGAGMAVSWNIRHTSKHAELGSVLSHVLGAAGEAAGLEGVQVTVKKTSPAARVIKGRVAGKPGAHTAKDIQDRAAHIESGAGLPPNTLAFSGAPDDRGVAEFTLSDPRVLTQPVPWPGPSAPGASIAKPIRPALWQTGEPVLAQLVPVSHWILAGMTGSAKSTGGGWSLLAEIITRHDVDVYGLDITKGDQTLGPFRDCFATDAPGCETGLLTEPGHAAPFLGWLRQQIRPRTDFLHSRGLQAWQEDCGLRLKIAWMEEAPDITDEAGDDATEQWVRALKAMRTAGIMCVYSCQRPDWSQLPTLARAQFAGRAAMGVNTSGDADLCMTERQNKAGCEPEQWADRNPGMAYLDARWVTDAQVTLPARFFYWGGDNTLITEHCRAFARDDIGDDMDKARLQFRTASPGAQRGFTFDLAPDPAPVNENLTAEQLAAQVLGDDTDPIGEADMDAPAPAGDWVFDADDPPAGPVPEPTARGMFDAWLAARLHTNPTFRAADLVELRAQAGKSRSWLYDELAARTARGELSRAKDDGTWTVVKAA